MRCESCGRDLPRGAAFCPECGARTANPGTEEIIGLARTAGLTGREGAGGVPAMPEMAEIPEDAPAIPDIAPLPEAAGMVIPGGETATTEEATVSRLDSAKLREEQRRAVQALEETQQTTREERLEQLAEGGSQIAAHGYEVEDVYPTPEPPPPPPPPSAEERMWEETRERAAAYGVDVPGEPTAGRQALSALKEADKKGQRFCALGCAAFFILFFIIFLVGLIMDFVR
jgi:hypothetical protein